MLCLLKRPKVSDESSFPRKSRVGVGVGNSLPHLEDPSMKHLLVLGMSESDTLWDPLGG